MFLSLSLMMDWTWESEIIRYAIAIRKPEIPPAIDVATALN
jgi:hypothetical protein